MRIDKRNNMSAQERKTERAQDQAMTSADYYNDDQLDCIPSCVPKIGNHSQCTCSCHQIKMITVQSSNISRIGFRADDGECGLVGTLAVEFVGSTLYHYFKVHLETYQLLLKESTPGGSVGRVFTTLVRANKSIKYKRVK